jgi:hypothetical protein
LPCRRHAVNSRRSVWSSAVSAELQDIELAMVSQEVRKRIYNPDCGRAAPTSASDKSRPHVVA